MASPASNGVPAINGSVDKRVDFANYFCTYAFLYHQKEMLSDRVRMDAYYNAIFNNKHHFAGKVSPFTLLPTKICFNINEILWLLSWIHEKCNWALT